MRNRTSRLSIALILASAALTGCTSTGTLLPQIPPAPAVSSVAPDGVSQTLRTPETKRGPSAGASTVSAAKAKLASITVKGRAPKTGYTRAQFGQAWADVDRNGCDTRNDELKAEMSQVRFKPGSDCVVLTGVLSDPYTGKTINFVRGKDSAKVQIDHLVPLNEAWQKGAQQWDEKKRTAFANDPINLRAVDGPSNSAKGAKDLATWLPKNRGHWCTYVAEIIEVKAKYGVWMTAAEYARAGEILASC